MVKGLTGAPIAIAVETDGWCAGEEWMKRGLVTKVTRNDVRGARMMSVAAMGCCAR